MIVGLGIDIVEVERIRHAMKNPRFIERVLTPKEREHCITAQQVAGRWAAKEAVAKAVGLHLAWHDVEILPDETGLPTPRVVSNHFDPGRLRLKVSISHERKNAIAVAVLERVTIQRSDVLI